MDLLIVCLIVFLSHIVEGITGFGCMILALPFVSSILGLQTAVPVLVLLSTVFDLILISKGTCCINWKESKKIILITLFFMPFGFFLLRYVYEDFLMRLLGIFILLIAIDGLCPKNHIPKNHLVFCLPIAGLIQGAFGGSGPFMVLYSQSVLKDKTVFRNTMAFIWIILNLFNLIQYSISGMLTSTVWNTFILLCPVIIAGYITGTILHHKIRADLFSSIIYIILIITGISMLF